MAFPVEGWSGSVAVTMGQAKINGPVNVSVYGNGDENIALKQAQSALSLDEDGAKWSSVGKTDSVV
jgi:hypothetical protein